MISDQERKLAEQVIQLHDGISFELLQQISIPSTGETSQSSVTEDMYIAVCESIKRELGVVNTIDFIDSLTRSSSKLTLWKVKYSSSEDEVCWAVGFDSETSRVKDILVNW